MVSAVQKANSTITTAARSGRHVIVRSTVLAFLLACCSCAFALDPSLDVSQYAHTSWKIRDGFTKGAITSIAQTPDGYLWLGTEYALVRFDGVRTVPWQPPPNQHLPSSEITHLLTARDGTLWIGTGKGLASWKDGRLTQYPELAGPKVRTLLEDRDGTVWVGTMLRPFPGKLCAIHNGSVQCFGEDGSLGPGVVGLFEDSKSTLWVGGTAGLWRWKPGPPKFYSLPGQRNGISGLAEDQDGSLLIAMPGGIRRVVDGETEMAYPFPDLAQFEALKLLRDRDGGLWIGTRGSGLVHVHHGRTDVFAQSDGLSSENVLSLFEDREANLWVGTFDGLDRFRELAVPTLSVKQGLSHAFPLSVLAATDGSVWLATNGGLNRWRNGQITTFDKRDGKLNGLAPDSLFQDARGRIWVSTPGEFGYLASDRFIPIRGVSGGQVNDIAEDTSGNLWIANQQAGLFQLFHGTVIQQIPWARLGHQQFATALVADRLQGGLWLGFLEGEVAYFADGQIRAAYGAADGLGEGRVSDLQLDPDGTVWAATEGGLSRLKDGRIATLRSSNGLPCDGVYWMMEDDAHSLWLYMTCGLVRIVRPELDAWVADPKRTIQVTVFDHSDGVRISASFFGYGPQVTKTSDGKLWFRSLDGVSVVDPQHLPVTQLPPPVHIEQITADRKTYYTTSDSVGRLRLPALSRDLQIDYTALSLIAPEKIRFRYKLEGYDSDWQDAGNRRQAFYTNLPPRSYRFRVTAANNSGVWNETGTFIDFTIAPAYYQTTWFRIAIGAVFLIILGAAYQLRVRQVARQVRGRTEERLEERERIARALHDTLLQSVQGLILKFYAVSKQIPTEAPARAALEKTLDHADQVLAEGRDRIRSLRVNPAALSDLPAAFRSVAEEIPQGREAIFKTVVEGHIRDLNPLVLEECYSIGREAIINALSHSQGHHIEAEIIYDLRQFSLRVRDDGRGIDPKILEDGERPGHWGLQGMRERAQKVGGQLRILSRPETGTELELTIPGATAYQGSSVKAKKFSFNRFSAARSKKPTNDGN
jgi:signal transduction histidine kinase/ligand-binding sensor domain-containing protein